jgi:hypothetical protein
VVGVLLWRAEGLLIDRRLFTPAGQPGRWPGGGLLLALSVCRRCGFSGVPGVGYLELGDSALGYAEEDGGVADWQLPGELSGEFAGLAGHSDAAGGATAGSGSGRCCRTTRTPQQVRNHRPSASHGRGWSLPAGVNWSAVTPGQPPASGLSCARFSKQPSSWKPSVCENLFGAGGSQYVLVFAWSGALPAPIELCVTPW